MTVARIVYVPEQLAMFEDQPVWPEGLRYAAGFITDAIQKKLILGIQALPL